jgi:hypothetical protein
VSTAKYTEDDLRRMVNENDEAILTEHERLEKLLTAQFVLDGLFAGASVLATTVATPGGEQAGYAWGSMNVQVAGSGANEAAEHAVDEFDAWADRFAGEWASVIGEDRATAFRLADADLETDDAVAAAATKRHAAIEELRRDADLFPHLHARYREA